jgi:predicted DNA-binding transcriptional regulator AlpA
MGRLRPEPSSDPTIEERDALWTPAMLSRYLGIPVATLYQWRQRSEGPPAVRLGKHLRYRPEAVREWLKSQEG